MYVLGMELAEGEIEYFVKILGLNDLRIQWGCVTHAEIFPQLYKAQELKVLAAQCKGSNETLTIYEVKLEEVL